MRYEYRHRVCWFLLMALMLSPFLPGKPALAKTDVIQIKYRWASEALPIVKHFLSPEGIVTADKRTNSLIITDTETVITRVRQFLDNFDTPPRRVRIRLRLNEGKASRDRELSASGSVSGGDWRVVIGDPDTEGVEIKAGAGERKQSDSHEYVINTVSGNRAYILTGTRIPYRQRWRDYCNRYGGCTETVTFYDADTGMEITPVVVGDHANIEITPRISHVDTSDPRGIIRFAGAATRLTVPLGRWVTIGGADRKGNDVLREILAGGSGKNHDSLSMSIMVETY